jgi:hypothetical protein
VNSQESLENHPGWQWCTSEGSELHTLLMGLESTFREKIQWLEEAENLTLAMRAGREKREREAQGGAPPPGEHVNRE